MIGTHTVPGSLQCGFRRLRGFPRFFAGGASPPLSRKSQSYRCEGRQHSSSGARGGQAGPLPGAANWL
ncbi:hypothetical protein TNCV_1504151 [Trichonephila clavipes]|uniref:Uncharacterized protein n=1 Tax=Trichonephila clavipes TaxID=2585209 RepID=A0A8X6RU43_TRICX|nr:hypothetical protein TNCV_1504151 [Trichonephila clavipes]